MRVAVLPETSSLVFCSKRRMARRAFVGMLLAAARGGDGGKGGYGEGGGGGMSGDCWRDTTRSARSDAALSQKA